MRERKSARLLVVSPSGHLLLFRFVHTDDALAGRTYWATPGGALEDGETFQDAAIRELREETGMSGITPVGPVANREFDMLMPNGEMVTAVEKYFIARVESQAITDSGWNVHEHQVMADHKWWSAPELRSTVEKVWPEKLVEILVDAGIFEPAT